MSKQKSNNGNGSKNNNDHSPKVHQREKVDFPIFIRELNWTDKQKDFIVTAMDRNTKMMVVDGPAGVSKTLLSVLASLKMLQEKRISDLIYIRSTVQSGDGATGFLSGDLDQKMYYFNIPLIDKLQELLDKNTIDRLIKEGRIQTLPTSMLRGYNFAAQSVILDEAQNTIFGSLVTTATRIAQFSKLFILGDRTQNDLGQRSGFTKFYNIFDNQESKDNGIHCFKFNEDDIMRSEFVKFIVKKLSIYS